MVQKQDLLRNNERVGFSLHDTNMATALRTAEADAQTEGLVVASMPEILVLKIEVPFTDSMWSTWYTCNSEEDVGTTPQGNKVVITVHGGGILTSERIQMAYELNAIAKECSASFRESSLYREPFRVPQCAALLVESEVRKLLDGTLADGTQIPVYSFADLKQGIKDKPRQYAVVMDFAEAQKAASSYNLPVESLRENPLVIVRAGGVAEANAFVDKVAKQYTTYGNAHPFNEINSDENQACLLCVGNDYSNGLTGCGRLFNSGCFVVVSEALVGRSADAKKSPLERMVSLQLPREFAAGLEAGAETITYNGRTYDLRK